jgi:hypothetical protein
MDDSQAVGNYINNNNAAAAPPPPPSPAAGGGGGAAADAAVGAAAGAAAAAAEKLGATAVAFVQRAVRLGVSLDGSKDAARLAIKGSLVNGVRRAVSVELHDAAQLLEDVVQTADARLDNMSELSIELCRVHVATVALHCAELAEMRDPHRRVLAQKQQFMSHAAHLSARWSGNIARALGVHSTGRTLAKTTRAGLALCLYPALARRTVRGAETSALEAVQAWSDIWEAHGSGALRALAERCQREQSNSSSSAAVAAATAPLSDTDDDDDDDDYSNVNDDDYSDDDEADDDYSDDDDDDDDPVVLPPPAKKQAT